MKQKSIISACALVLLVATMTAAQTLKIDEPKQLTFLHAGSNQAPWAVTNGTEWGVAYTRTDNTGNLYFLRTTYDGAPIVSRQILQGKDGDAGYRNPVAIAHPGGWAVTSRYRKSGGEANYFVVLDKSGRKVGPPAVVVENDSRLSLPIWTGSMFIVFYNKDTKMGYWGVWAAYFDAKGKRIGPDRLVTELLEMHFVLYRVVVPTSSGITLFIEETDADERTKGYFFLKVGLDGKPILNGNYINLVVDGEWISRLGDLVWNGTGFAVAGTTRNAENENRIISRLVSPKGQLQSKEFVHAGNGVEIGHGIAFDGTHYASFALNADNDTVFCQQLDNKMRAVGPPLIVDDSNGTGNFSRVVSVGSDVFHIAYSRKVGFSNAFNLYYSRVRFPHPGKPKVTFFNGAVHKFQGKKYAFLDWHVAGADQVVIKTKGGRWTLPASGFHAVEIKKDATFKIVAKNGAGSSKAKMKVKIKK